MATLSSKVTPSGVATAAQGALADSAVQPNDSPTFAGLTTTADVSFGAGVNATGTVTANGLSVQTATLGTTAGDSVQSLSLRSNSPDNNDYMLFTAERTSTGTAWTTAAHRTQRQVDATLMGYMQFGNQDTDLITFGENATEYMRIDGSGNVKIGTTTGTDKLNVIGRGSFEQALTGGFGTAALQVVSSTGNVGITLHCSGASAPILRNERGAGDVVDIVNSLQSAFSPIRASAFNVVSDYRLKENVQPLDGAAARVANLKPCRFSFIEGSMMYQDGSLVDGFIAHEVQDVIPEAVSGVKDDLMETGAPKHQSLDVSKLVPLLTAALQEALTKIEALEARLVALEADAP